MPYSDLKTQVDSAPSSPGVYRMLNAKADILYVGKARNLKKRLQSYLRSGLERKTQLLLMHVTALEFSVCKSESEALVHEADLIKTHKPHYNILLKDDKSFPYLHFTEHDAPRVDYVRARKPKAGRHFGPYPSRRSVKDDISLIQKLFKIRTCQDNVFAGRTRPCLLYQIGSCSAPCVGKISLEAYQEEVGRAILFLDGKNDDVVQRIQSDMIQAASDKRYELAATHRDQIAALRRLQSAREVIAGNGSLDAHALIQSGSRSLVATVTVRMGRLMGVRSYEPLLRGHEFSQEEVMLAFLTQYYLNESRSTDLPELVLVDLPLSKGELDCLSQAVKLRSGSPFAIRTQRFGRLREWVDLAHENAQESIKQKVSAVKAVMHQLNALKSILEAESLPAWIEGFDVSHTGGELMVASCVVFRDTEMDRRSYRRYNISSSVTPGDDYAAIREAATRRYQSLSEGDSVPDIILIDGGKGQLKAVASSLSEHMRRSTLLSIAKGPERLEGREQILIWRAGHVEVLPVPYDSPARDILQRVRDESHRFALTGHRAKRSARRIRSVLEEIPGVGKQRRQVLLTHFGGLANLKRASQEDIKAVPGIGVELAMIIFRHLHQ